MANEGTVTESIYVDGDRWRPIKAEINVVEIPAAGTVQMIIRVTTDDRRDIVRACNVLGGMEMTSFIRMAVINTARTLIAEAQARANQTFQGGQGGDATPETGGDV